MAVERPLVSSLLESEIVENWHRRCLIHIDGNTEEAIWVDTLKHGLDGSRNQVSDGRELTDWFSRQLRLAYILIVEIGRRTGQIHLNGTEPVWVGLPSRNIDVQVED